MWEGCTSILHSERDPEVVKRFDHLGKYLWNDMSCSAPEVYALCERVEEGTYYLYQG